MTAQLVRSRSMQVIEWVFRATVFLVAVSTAKATHFAITQKSAFLEAFPGAPESVYLSFIIAGFVGFVALVGLFYFQRWATWVFVGLALFVTIVNLGVAAPLLHTLSGIALTLAILILGSLCRERFH